MSHSYADRVVPAKTKTESLIADVRRSGLGREVIPMEAVVGWPYFQLRGRPDKKVLLSVPFCASWRVGLGKTLVFAPSHVVQVEWGTGRVVKYFRPEFDDMWSSEVLAAPVASFPHERLRPYTVAQYLSLRTEIYRGYDLIGESLQGNGQTDSTALDKFMESLRLAMEPGLEGFYRQLAPKFFDRFLPYVTSPESK